MGEKGPLAGDLRSPPGAGPRLGDAWLFGGSGPSARRRPKKGDLDAEALGRSRGGFRALIHVVCDELGNPLEIALTPGKDGDLRLRDTRHGAVSCARGRLSRQRVRFL